MKHLLAIFLFLVIVSLCQAQSLDSLVLLPEVEVNANLSKNNHAKQSTILDKTDLRPYKGHSAADILESEGLSFVKSYGSGSIATFSVRGGAAGQTAVFWNELPIQSPMLGLLDLSILHVGNIDELEFTKGGQSTALGSGAVSGNLQLKSGMPKKDWQLELNSSIGSFAQQRQSFNISGGSDKLRFRSAFHKNSAENNFSFQIRSDLPTRKLQHARTDQNGFEQGLFWQINPQHRLHFHYWQQASNRLIPPTTVQTRSEARQEDAFNRFAIRYLGQSKKAVLESQVAYFKERILYEDPQILLTAPSQFKAYIFQSSVKRTFGLWSSVSKAQFIHNTAEADGYSEEQTQSYLALHQGLSRVLFKNTKLELGGRLTFLRFEPKPITAFKLKIEGQLAHNIGYHFRLSKDFRLPTLNDLYWIPGGNSDLKTEYSLGQEIGLAYQNSKEAFFSTKYQLNIFNRNVDNWIQWTQLEGASIWSVNNITKVWSRGVEQQFNGQFTLKKTVFSIQLKLDWIKSTYQTAIINPSIEKGESLWYTPEWQALTKVKVSLPKWSFFYSHRWISATTGINDDLDAYHLGTLQIQYGYVTNKNKLNVFTRLNNIWDYNYRIIERRPMPGRAFEIGMNLGFVK